jgi:sulfur carrier protein
MTGHFKMQITIYVNGKEHVIDTQEVDSLDALVKTLVDNDKGLIVEVNETIVHRQHWKEHSLNDGDTVELISFVGGG